MFASAGVALGCAPEPNRAPVIEPIAPLTIAVGEIAEVPLRASDEDGDFLTFAVASMPLTASLEIRKNVETFVWAPLISDTGPAGRVHDITVTVDDGRGGLASRTFSITVLPQSGAPEFLGPEGHVLNLSEDDDISFLVAIKDDDTTEVDLILKSDPIPGARFTQLDGKTASFYWRPTPEQLASRSYWQLVVVADDKVHPSVERQYSILLMNADEKKSCPGTAPVLEPCGAGSCVPLTDVDGASAIAFRIDARDAESTIRELVLHYTLQNPLSAESYAGNELLLERCEPEDDVGCPDEERQRYFIGTLASPAAQSSEPLLFHYFITAVDDDDLKSTTCDHTARLPKVGHYTLAAYPKLWQEGCKDDAYEADTTESAPSIEAGVTYDLRYCASDGLDVFRLDAAPGSTVSVELVHEARHGSLMVVLIDETFTEIPTLRNLGDRISAKITSGPVFVVVEAEPGKKRGDQTYGLAITRSPLDCPNDSAEPNDSPDEAVLAGDNYDGVATICPADRDVYVVSAGIDESIVVDLAFQHAFGDLDVELRAGDGETVLTRSASDQNDEQLVWHVDELGNYYIVVTGHHGDSNSASLSIRVVETATLCFEDEFAPNQGVKMSKLLPENTYYDLLSCPGKEDWFRIDVNEGERLTVLAIPYQPANAPLDLQVFNDTDGKVVAGTVVATNELNGIQWDVTAEGKPMSFRWRIKNLGPYTAFYDMAVAVEDASGFVQCQDDRFSPLDSIENSLPVDTSLDFITRLKVCPGGVDWFSVRGAAFEELYAYIYGFSDEAPLVAELYRQDAEGTTKIADGLSTSNGVEIRYMPEENVDLFIRVLGAPGETHHYDLVFGSD